MNEFFQSVFNNNPQRQEEEERRRRQHQQQQQQQQQQQRDNARSSRGGGMNYPFNGTFENAGVNPFGNAGANPFDAAFANLPTNPFADGGFFSRHANVFTQQAEAFAREAMDPQNNAAGPSAAPPPASTKALRQLPTIRVSPEDLIDPNNRECCICLEENHLNDLVIRLPCAHIFHRDCIHDWLNRHCTCPVCRYELETSDGQYEASRRVRMAQRKPRMHLYELERMSIQELQKLARQVRLRGNNTKKTHSQLVQALANSGKIDMIATPKPVEYTLSSLQQMGVAKLRQTMKDAGVFFDPLDVVEKADMISIFVHSGRLNLLPETNANATKSIHNYNTVPITSETPSIPVRFDDDDCEDLNNVRPMEPMVETVIEEDQEDDVFVVVEPISESVTDMFGSENGTAQQQQQQETRDLQRTNEPRQTSEESDGTNHVVVAAPATYGSDDGGAAGGAANETGVASTAQVVEDIDDFDDGQMQGIDAVDDAGSWEDMDMPKDDELDDGGSPPVRESDEQPNIQAQANPETTETTYPSLASLNGISRTNDEYDRLAKKSISQLRAMAHCHSVDLSNCIERSEIVDKILEAIQKEQEANRRRPTISRHDFEDWSVSSVRALGAAIEADLSHCIDRDEMIQTLLQEARMRPYVTTYLDAWMPLAGLSISQLRSMAREWRVNLNDCIEKEEMIQRLATAKLHRRT